jgi:phosphatidate cytidylyltransferase
MDDPHGRNADEDHEPTAAEGVRIIGAEEAAEAMERGEVSPRLSDDTPRYGDRPKPPPEGARPALRFPLKADSDPSDVTRPPILPARLPGDDPSPSGSVELPPWTAEATGEVPAVLAESGATDEDLDAWSSFATSSPTRWHGAQDEWEEPDEYAAALGDDEDRLGALDESDRPSDEDLFSFDDVDDLVEQRAAERAAMRARDVSGSTSLFGASGVGTDDPTLDDFDDVPVFERSGTVVIGAGDHHDGVPAERPGRRRTARPAPADPGVARGADSGTGGGRDVPTAIAAGVGIAVLALVCFALGSAVATVLVTVVVGLSAIEYFGAVQRAGARPAALLGLLAAVTFPLATYWRGEAAVPLMLALTLVFGLLWYLVGAGGDTPVVEGVGITLLGVVWIGLLGSYATQFLRVDDGVGILLAIILATVAYDIGAFFMGRSFGQRPLSAASPNKTVEGLLGGVFVAALVGLLIGGLNLGTPFHGFGHGLLLGVVVGVAATFGDLCESLVKRDLGVKDMGTLIPGHGGVLDRIDGLLFVLPAVYYLIVGLHWA